MKPLIFFVVLLFISTAPRPAHALFGHTAQERHRRMAVEERLSQAQQKASAQEQWLADQQRQVIEQQKVAGRWQTTAFVLGIATAFALIIGTAIGSKGRSHAARGE